MPPGSGAAGGSTPQMQPQITAEDLEMATTSKCEKCQAVVFNQGFIMKKTSPLSKVGETLLQLPVVYCVMCGTILPDSCPFPID